jgi:hypothetical protein
MAHCPPTIRDRVTAELGTGVRLGELLAMRADAVKLDDATAPGAG